MNNRKYSVKIAGKSNIQLNIDDSETVMRNNNDKTEMNQITIRKFEIMPEISTINNIYLRVDFGRVGLKLNDEYGNIYTSGLVIKIPARSKMILSNQFKEDSTVFLLRI